MSSSPNTQNHILLVEDYQANILVATTLLEHFGYSYDVASSGGEALAKLEANAYSLVLMDVQMQGMDGFEATKRWRAQEAKRGLPRVPVIAMTAHSMAGDKERCLAAGMDDYIAKPFNPAELQAKLQQWLN